MNNKSVTLCDFLDYNVTFFLLINYFRIRPLVAIASMEAFCYPRNRLLFLDPCLNLKVLKGEFTKYLSLDI